MVFQNLWLISLPYFAYFLRVKVFSCGARRNLLYSPQNYIFPAVPSFAAARGK